MPAPIRILLALALGAATATAAPRPMPRPAGEPAAVVLCGDPAIVGERLAALEGPGGCGITRPVRVRSVAGVALDPPAVLDCPTARRLSGWLAADVKPALAGRAGRLVGIDIAAAYVCRNVNYAEDGDLSEHATGAAIDVARFRLAGGAVLSVADDWGRTQRGRLLQRLLDAACGPFTTVLGPASDAEHADHFHLGIAPRRSAYCP